MKVASIHPENASASPPRPTESAVFLVVDEDTKAVVAILDGPSITTCKTAADSALAAKYLSREDSEVLLVLGAGPIARALTDAYLYIRPSIRQVILWNRTPSKLESAVNELIRRGVSVCIADDLDLAVAQADIISSATSSTSPIIRGRSVRPGTHVDLVGGFRPDMQEADILLISKSKVFVDDRQSAAIVGDIVRPVESGGLLEVDIQGDLFDLCQNQSLARKSNEITVFKNAGGAHLDLIVSQYVISKL
ncbi:ornithine cyclodeaminase [Pseudomonas sp. WHRI 8519]|uniref:ornithine cyclodeaminase family protein n=1 Tax=Pseudomonas sp. WHRI 8519 TaxID=3162567 RepID=UPI0032EE1188